MSPFPCTSKFTRDIMGYFRPAKKTALSTVENNMVVYPLLPPWALHDGFCFSCFYLFQL
jgi:hypothetical protein